MNQKFNTEAKKNLIEDLIIFITKNNVIPIDETLLDFLSSFWNIDALESTDSRFDTARDDIQQHIINNSDWTYGDLFKTRLRLIDLADENLISFIKKLGTLIRDNQTQDLYIKQLRNSLPNNFEVSSEIESSTQQLKITIADIGNYELCPKGISENKIPFIVLKQSHDYFEWVKPSFILVQDNTWNDYSAYTKFILYYQSSSLNNHRTKIGILKIMHKSDDNTMHAIEENFMSLSNEFCSIGQSVNYYENLKNILNNELLFEAILYSLKDIAFFPGIYELFSTNWKLHDSLLRYEEPQQLLDHAKKKMAGLDVDIYSFTYKFRPKYSSEVVNVNFNFEGNLDGNRIVTVIGKNGAGKTQLLSDIILDLSLNDKKSFVGEVPFFSKIIAVSFSIFDKFKLPIIDAGFNYAYCGIRKSQFEFFKHKEIEDKIINSLFKLAKYQEKRIQEYKELLSIFLTDTIMSILTQKINKDSFTEDVEQQLRGVINTLSSGQSMMLNVIARLLSEIRINSIILFDEPETHLHPNAIAEIISFLFNLIEKYKSFCIISTHSPIIIQQVKADSVVVIKKEEHNCKVSQLSNESFGENLSVINERIFGSMNVPEYFISKIEKLIHNENTLKSIKQKLSSKDLPMSLDATLYIKTLFDEYHKSK